MIVLPIEPFYDKLKEKHREEQCDEDFWDWIKNEYGAYQVWIKSNPTAVGEKEAAGLAFYDEEESTLFALRWS